MKKQRSQWMMAAILTICGATMVLTSCVDNDDNPTSTAIDVELTENPTEDALSETTDKTYVMYGEFDEDFGNALGRRLKGTMTSPTNADIFVVDPSAVNLSGVMTIEELNTLIRRTESGEASLVLTKSTFREFYTWAQTYVMGYLLMELENFYGDYDSPEAAPARRKMANIMRNAYMAGQTETAKTRATTVNDVELDWEHVNTWPEEKQNAVMFDGFAQSGDNELFIMNAAATLNADTEVEQPQNDYEWGNKADAMVDWLNRQGKQNAQTRAGMKNFARAVTRAASPSISDLMSAQTKEFVFEYLYPSKGKNAVYTKSSALKVQYIAYSAYDFKNDVEYYQVRQNITAMNNKIFDGTPDSRWWGRRNDGDYNLARGAWMKRIDTKMWLEGSGTKSIMSYGPQNENGTSSGSTSTGGSSSVTTGTSEGYSLGVSVGSSIGLTGPSASLSASYGESYTTSYSNSDGITWSTTTSWNKKDVKTTCIPGTDANKTVSWKHEGNTPTTDEGTKTDQVPDLLKLACTTDEQVLWIVQKPKGVYTLKASFNVVNEIVKIKGHFNNRAFVTQDNPHDISFELNAPDRFKYEWNCYYIERGTPPEDMNKMEYSYYLDDYIEKKYGNKSSNFCWAGSFISTEATKNGSDNARAVFQNFKNSIRGMKDDLRDYGAGGRMVLGLKLAGLDKYDEPYDPIDSVALVLDGTGYNVGETFTQKLNGYRLTYKVTKKGSEVELSSVPVEFSGELVIPEKVSDGMLAVTSLGVNCAKTRKGITDVTIPSTVKTIQTGALAEMNITTITIPEGVTDIGSWSFHLDNQLTKIYLPSTLTAIMNSAFCRCEAITEIHIKATTPPSVGAYGFNPAYKTATLYVPNGYKDTYAKANYWKSFNNIVEE